MTEFSGFPKECIPFLEMLALNNHREWFNDNKQDYENYVREPALAFIEATGDKLHQISPRFRASAKKSGGSLMRIYRDTRFTKEKTPYKTNIGIQFRHERGKDVHAPGFYVHIEPGDCFVGVGIWRPETRILSKIRDFIVDNPSGWQSAIKHKPFKSHYRLVGESLKRAPRGYAADHPLIEDLKRKDFIACSTFNEEEIKKKGFPGFATDLFLQGDHFMRYLCTALEVEY